MAGGGSKGGGCCGGSGGEGGEQCAYTSLSLLHLPVSELYAQKLKSVESYVCEVMALAQPSGSFLK